MQQQKTALDVQSRRAGMNEANIASSTEANEINLHA
jgi:hypothetical protein